ncbi:tRNA (adenosine(37)-N6)-threonylcarbamoyltransferase complex dimerization subunit type 1 TsaB [Sediminibacterium soli]|uniref:tRNA (adenosine(37)-N6)-threonylcarbamoyltransferase complex dimerization subunit type 1 TsaB n=1 Tax=Sediminibacterium soli TaxID=2698829 RepID=UPI00137A21E5|nr:tRNA (adenosine(37)-N6)-threonylcarbamoyltransferase complex dimerization subunit type 1 TsaB [Sediminibacterium soli]NCI47631.1 tRNA (adenosine(37)-N6)-threonylcarbamoyltransferase complex dimerization subunit type 1 TsaB [Sediminibacterium soli]
MPTILYIDTATDLASVCISSDERVLGITESSDQKNHASFIQSAIAELCAQTGTALPTLDAVAVTAGPGSYTGLRVGMATAKGICYALQKPLIALTTLEVMAQAALSKSGIAATPAALLCPMIDARRMEVFTALFDQSMRTKKTAHALIIDEQSFAAELEQDAVLFFGSGMPKFKHLIQHTNALFTDIKHNATDMVLPALAAFRSSHFTDLAYSEPVYVKEFFSPTKLESN